MLMLHGLHTFTPLLAMILFPQSEHSALCLGWRLTESYLICISCLHLQSKGKPVMIFAWLGSRIWVVLATFSTIGSTLSSCSMISISEQSLQMSYLYYQQWWKPSLQIYLMPRSFLHLEHEVIQSSSSLIYVYGLLKYLVISWFLSHETLLTALLSATLLGINKTFLVGLGIF